MLLRLLRRTTPTCSRAPIAVRRGATRVAVIPTPADAPLPSLLLLFWLLVLLLLLVWGSQHAPDDGPGGAVRAAPQPPSGGSASRGPLRPSSASGRADGARCSWFVHSELPARTAASAVWTAVLAWPTAAVAIVAGSLVPDNGLVLDTLGGPLPASLQAGPLRDRRTVHTAAVLARRRCPHAADTSRRRADRARARCTRRTAAAAAAASSEQRRRCAGDASAIGRHHRGG